MAEPPPRQHDSQATGGPMGGARIAVGSGAIRVACLAPARCVGRSCTSASASLRTAAHGLRRRTDRARDGAPRPGGLVFASSVHGGQDMRTTSIFLIVLAVIAGGSVGFADTHSDFSKQYNLTALKTFDFKQQNRISSDPIANNQIWNDDIRSAIAANLAAHGMVQDGTAAPDFLVAYYVGLTKGYDVRSIGYGMPFYGRGFRGWGGWPRGYDAWSVPYTESTLIIDIIDARTNQPVWRRA